VDPSHALGATNEHISTIAAAQEKANVVRVISIQRPVRVTSRGKDGRIIQAGGSVTWLAPETSAAM
jgi:hypothetical protein